MLKAAIIQSEINPGVLSKITLNSEEKASGKLIDLNSIQEAFLSYEEDENTETTMVSFLDSHLVPDKVNTLQS